MVARAVEQHEQSLLRYALEFTRDLELARDVVQDTFVRLCRQLQAGEDDPAAGGYLRQWLFTVCRNRAIDVSRKERRMRTMTTDEATAQPSRDQQLDTAVETRDTAAMILRLVDDLPRNQREVVRLKFQGGLSYREIAGVTQLSVSNVGYLLHTALSSVRERLQAGPSPAEKR